MSWSLGNKKWTIPFKSLGNVSCHIDIFKRGYTGSVVTELSINNASAPGVAGANPIYFEEDDDEDLLTVVRTKTGYINLVETTYGGLSELYPSKNTDLYVEFYYGQTLNFIGFVQAQSFDNDWKAAPRELSIPIISPLGLLNNIKMKVYNPPQAISLAALLDDVLDLLGDLGVAYEGVTWPQLSMGLDATISSLVTSPFDSDWSPANTTVSLFKPVTAYDYIEGLCNAFGWIVHETPTQMVFSMFDHTGNYKYVTAANLRTLTNVQTLPSTGSTTVALTNYATPADNNGKESSVVPVEKVRLSYGGEYVDSAKFNFDHMVYNGATIDGNQYVAWLTMITAPNPNRTPEISGGDYESYLLPSNTFYNGRLVSEGVNPCSCGSRINQKECLLVNLPGQNLLGWIFTVRFYDRPTGSDLIIKWKSRWGNTILTLSDDGTIAHKKVGVRIVVGDKFYHGQGQWSTTVPTGYWDADTEITNVPSDLPIELRFYQTRSTGENPVQTLTIEDLTIEELPSSWHNWNVVQADEDIIYNGNGDGDGEATVEMMMTAYRKRNNQIGTSVVTTRFTDYQYLLKSNARLQIRFKKTATLPSWIYYVYMSFMSQSWRIISISEYPWDDEVVITMQRVIN